MVSRAIQSVLEQRCRGVEIVCVDDGSSDGSLDAIKSFGSAVHWLSGPNKGSAAARNRGLEVASGEYVIFLDADDYFEGPIVQGLVSTAQRKDADLVIGRSITESENGIRSAEHCYPIDATAQDLIHGWLRGQYVQTGAIMWRRGFLRSIGGWDERVMKHQDIEVVMRTLLHGARTAVCDIGRVIWWDHASPYRMSMTRSEEKLRSEVEFHDRLWDLAAVNMDFLRPAFANAYYSLARNAYFWGWPELARYSLSRARALGFEGHGGGTVHALTAKLIGLQGKERLARFLRVLREAAGGRPHLGRRDRLSQSWAARLRRIVGFQWENKSPRGSSADDLASD